MANRDSAKIEVQVPIRSPRGHINLPPSPAAAMSTLERSIQLSKPLQHVTRGSNDDVLGIQLLSA